MIDPRSLARALGGEASGNNILAPGPGHSQHDRSLSILIDPQAAEGFVCNSFAGDDPIACRDYVRERAGLDAWKPQAPTPSRSFTAEYLYRDAKGEPSRKVCRTSGKDFPQFRWAGGRWVAGVKEAPMLPYRLPELIASDGDVFITEGEKDSDRLVSLGLTATTNPGGAKGWKPDLNQWFAGRVCFILEDDDSAGRTRVWQIAEQLHSIASEVRIVRFLGIGPGADVSDWLDRNSTESFVEYAKGFPVWSAQQSGGFEQSEPLDTLDLASAPAGNAITGQILGIGRFDIELDAMLMGCGWRIMLNQLSGELEIHGAHGVIPMTDERLAEIRFTVAYASNGKEPAKDKLVDAVALIGERRPYHPVSSYLSPLQWDGIPRLDSWLIDFAGAEDTALNRAFARKSLCAAVRRVRQPGSKFDHALVLCGPQGVRKSSLIKALCHDDRWFTDQLKVGAGAKETLENANGAWIVELAELDGLSRREASAAKSFVTTTFDRARLSYGRYATTRPRQFILIGSTNEATFLNDLTGNRRWWICNVASCDPDGLALVRDQLWAEALVVEPHEALWLDDEALQTDAAMMTKSVTDFGPWAEMLEGQIPADIPLKIEASAVWRIVGIDCPENVRQLTKAHHSHMRAAMASLGFERRDSGIRNAEGRKVRAYLRGDTLEAVWWRPGERPPGKTSYGEW